MARVLPMPLGVSPAGTELLERCLEGEAGAWREFYSIHASRLGRFLERMGVPAADVEDVLQDVFVALHDCLGDYDGRTAFKGWLLGVAMNHVRAHRRRLWRRRLGRLAGFGGWSDDPDDPELVLGRDEALQELQWILSRMNDTHREAFVLYEIEELDGNSIAQILGCPLNTVWSRVRLARDDFRRLLRRRNLVRDGGHL